MESQRRSSGQGQGDELGGGAAARCNGDELLAAGQVGHRIAVRTGRHLELPQRPPRALVEGAELRRVAHVHLVPSRALTDKEQGLGRQRSSAADIAGAVGTQGAQVQVLQIGMPAGAVAVRDVAEVSAGFGDRKVAFLRAPSGWIFEIIEIIRDRVPEV